jgi:L-ascorbate 6-phosphate lactonase
MEPSVALQFLGGASFLVHYGGQVAAMDLYLSDACRHPGTDAYKRLFPPPVLARDVHPTVVLTSHDHGDHMDAICLPDIMAQNKKAVLVGPASVKQRALTLNIDANQIRVIAPNEKLSFGPLHVTAGYCDHGSGAPDAVSLIIEVYGRRIFFVGDCSYTPDWPARIGDIGAIDAMLVPINGDFGNPDPTQAAHMTRAVMPKTVIPCHTGLFAEQGGSYGLFMQACKELSVHHLIKILSVGEDLTL